MGYGGMGMGMHGPSHGVAPGGDGHYGGGAGGESNTQPSAAPAANGSSGNDPGVNGRGAPKMSG